MKEELTSIAEIRLTAVGLGLFGTVGWCEAAIVRNTVLKIRGTGAGSTRLLGDRESISAIVACQGLG